MAEAMINKHFLFLLLPTFLALIISSSYAKPGGLTIELVHRHSPKSPLYQPNLTFHQKIDALVRQSTARVHYIKHATTLALSSSTNGTSSSYSPETIRMYMNSFQDWYLFTVQIGIGTDPPPALQPPQGDTRDLYNFLFDTGSDLTWLQCEECRTHRCFESVDEPFRNSASGSYKSLPCGQHPLCEKDCHGNDCSFYRGYGDAAYGEASTVSGILATEIFGFSSSDGQFATEFGYNLVFGCVTNTTGVPFAGDHNRISGRMGFGFGPRSFVSQLDIHSRGRFSYCLRRERGAGPTNSFLKFGNDIEQKPNLRVIELRRLNELPHYFVNLIGISINGRKVDIPTSQFAPQPDGTGGTIIDSGSAFSHFVKPVHDMVVGTLHLHFKFFGDALKISPTEGDPFQLCYEVVKPEMFPGLPVITFNFPNNVNMDLEPEGAFISFPAEGQRLAGFCFAVIEAGDPHLPNIIGAYHQTNFRFIYDTKRFTLSFGKEDCFRSS